MGGVLARGIFHMFNYLPGSVSLILTLGAPHRYPVMACDAQLLEFYERTNYVWGVHESSDSVNAGMFFCFVCSCVCVCVRVCVCMCVCVFLRFSAFDFHCVFFE